MYKLSNSIGTQISPSILLKFNQDISRLPIGVIRSEKKRVEQIIHDPDTENQCFLHCLDYIWPSNEFKNLIFTKYPHLNREYHSIKEMI